MKETYIILPHTELPMLLIYSLAGAQKMAHDRTRDTGVVHYVFRRCTVWKPAAEADHEHRPEGPPADAPPPTYIVGQAPDHDLGFMWGPQLPKKEA